MPRPISACEMALIRLAHAAELPPTDNAGRRTCWRAGLCPRRAVGRRLRRRLPAHLVASGAADAGACPDA